MSEDDETWGHWCYEQEPVRLPITQPKCPRCGALNLSESHLLR
jgi:hypothetical protein